MTQVEREHAARVLGDMKDRLYLRGEIAAGELKVILTAIAALRSPQPDPKTGLVPCGCGCNPELRVEDWGWYQVYCTGCDMHGGNSHTPDNVIEEWNEAMGWKGGAE